MSELVTSQAEFTNFHAQFMNETRAIFQTHSEYLKSLEIQVRQMAKNNKRVCLHLMNIEEYRLIPWSYMS